MIPGFPGKCPAELGGEGISSNYTMEQMCGTSQDSQDNYITTLSLPLQTLLSFVCQMS